MMRWQQMNSSQVKSRSLLVQHLRHTLLQNETKNHIDVSKLYSSWV